MVEIDKLCDRCQLSEAQIANALAVMAIHYAHGAEQTRRLEAEMTPGEPTAKPSFTPGARAGS